MQSYLDRGHPVVLYVAETVEGIPEGVEVRHAEEIYYPPPFDISDNDRQRVAVYSDIFLLYLFLKTDYIWCDLDAYCVKPLDFDSDWIFAFGKPDQVCTGVLKLPKHSRTLTELLEFVTSPCPIQPWRGKRYRDARRRLQESGEVWGVETLPWGCAGPKPFTHFLKETGEISYAMEKDLFYPVFAETLAYLFQPRIDFSMIEKPESYSVHIFGWSKKVIRSRGGLPPAGSYLEMICKRHGIDPTSCPVK